MQIVWEYCFQGLQIEVPLPGQNILITDGPYNQGPSREKFLEIFFESFQVNGIYLANPATLSLYSTGKVNGLVCDSGYGVTHAVPV